MYESEILDTVKVSAYAHASSAAETPLAAGPQCRRVAGRARIAFGRGGVPLQRSVRCMYVYMRRDQLICDDI